MDQRARLRSETSPVQVWPRSPFSWEPRVEIRGHAAAGGVDWPDSPMRPRLLAAGWITVYDPAGVQLSARAPKSLSAWTSGSSRWPLKPVIAGSNPAADAMGVSSRWPGCGSFKSATRDRTPLPLPKFWGMQRNGAQVASLVRVGVGIDPPPRPCPVPSPGFKFDLQAYQEKHPTLNRENGVRIPGGSPSCSRVAQLLEPSAVNGAVVGWNPTPRASSRSRSVWRTGTLIKSIALD